MAAIQNANADVGAMVLELSEREYMVRGLGYLESIGDIENVVVGRVGHYVAFPLRTLDYAPPEWKSLLRSDAARLLRAFEETAVTLPVPGVWLRVQLSAAVPEGEAVMGEAADREEETGRVSRRRRG